MQPRRWTRPERKDQPPAKLGVLTWSLCWNDAETRCREYARTARDDVQESSPRHSHWFSVNCPQRPRQPPLPRAADAQARDPESDDIQMF